MRYTKKDGFTLIEVSLVLGIAGLIFVMAFVAVPALWATARDAERRDDVLTFVQKLKDFQTNNNRGALPDLAASGMNENNMNGGTVYSVNGSTVASNTRTATSWQGFYRDFFTKDFADPDGTRYNLRIAKCRAVNIDSACNTTATTGINTSGSVNHILYVVLGAVCDGDVPKSSANSRKVAVLYKMERTTNAFCANT